MTTLYDLLGALPNDDAEDLRAAFRKAAKANHPDNNPGDPDAAQRFRQVVRANAILRDKRQRAHYDRLLEAALRQQGVKFGRRRFSLVTVIPYAVGCATFADDCDWRKPSDRLRAVQSRRSLGLNNVTVRC